MNTMQELKTTKFSDIFESKQQAVVSYLSLENRYQKLVAFQRKQQEIFAKGGCPLVAYSRDDVNKRPCKR